jgi:hypothetical protein
MTKAGKCIVVSDLLLFPESYFGIKFDLNYDLTLEYGKTKYRFIQGHQLENQTYPGEFLI